MTRRYHHVTDTIRQTVAGRVDGLLWGGGSPTGGVEAGLAEDT